MGSERLKDAKRNRVQTAQRKRDLALADNLTKRPPSLVRIDEQLRQAKEREQ